jgi:hypothetical protein
MKALWGGDYTDGELATEKVSELENKLVRVAPVKPERAACTCVR